MAAWQLKQARAWSPFWWSGKREFAVLFAWQFKQKVPGGMKLPWPVAVSEPFQRVLGPFRMNLLDEPWGP